MSNQDSTRAANTIIFGAMGIVFVTLKLCHVIDWSWWWVTAPFWGPAAAVLAMLFVVVASVFLYERIWGR